MPRRLYGWCAFLKQISDLLTQFRAVLVMMNLDRVLNRNFEQFLVRVRPKTPPCNSFRWDIRDSR